MTNKTLVKNTPRTAKKRQQRRRPSLILRWLRLSLRLQALLSPRWAGYRLYRLWFTSPKHPEPERERRWREQAETLLIPHRYGPIATYRWGKGDKRALLLHGWSGRGPQLGAFIDPLLKKGYQVVAFDAPGHGRTPGKTSSIFRMTEALQAVLAETGPAEVVITHSFGAMLLAHAMRHAGVQIGKAVCISSPTTPLFLVDRFCAVMQVGDAVRQSFMQFVEGEFGADVWDRLSADKNVRDNHTPALILHDEEDHDVPWQLGRQLADAWPGAQFQLTKGLGHRRILRNRPLIGTVMDFIN